MVYTNCLMVSQMKELDLFDDIEYKYIKNIIKHDDDDIEVEIEDVENDRVAWCKTRFTFELNINVSGGSMPIMVDKEFVVEKEYNGSSAYALMMIELYEEGEEEEEDEEDERLTAEYEATKDHRNSVSDDLEYLKFHCDNKKQVKRIFDGDYEGQFYYDIEEDDYLKEYNIFEEEEESV